MRAPPGRPECASITLQCRVLARTDCRMAESRGQSGATCVTRAATDGAVCRASFGTRAANGSILGGSAWLGAADRDCSRGVRRCDREYRE